MNGGAGGAGAARRLAVPRAGRLPAAPRSPFSSASPLVSSPAVDCRKGGAGFPSAPPSGRLRGRPGPDREPDFLPLQCDACEQDFHKDHFTCAAHKCPYTFEKIFIRRRSKEGCKKDMLQVICDQCHGSFRIQRRHPLDHGCPRGNLAVSVAGCAAARASDSEPATPSGALNTSSSSWLAQRPRWKLKR